ncbi:MAG: DUF4249 domain-containing protein [Bacteroidetes bacterium]|nr:DUF4249 domain-containing protein [Bacteroidota bacterium]
MQKVLFFLALSSLLFSCEKEIPLEQEEIAPRIVVNGIFAAGDTIAVNLSESRDVLYEGTLPNLTEATAKLYDGNDNFLGDFVHESNGVYKVPGYLPVAGMTYRIKVSSSGLTDVSAETNTPAVISVTSVDTLRKSDRMSYEIKFNDDPAVTNYYALTLTKMVIYVDDLTGEVYYYEDTYYSTSEIFTQNGSADVDGTKWGSIFLFSDASFNGSTCSFTAEQDIDDADSVVVAIGLRSVSEDYFKYSVSHSKYQETQGDPFAQPVQVYTNVENGFGIFGAYSAFTDTLIIQ